MSPQRIQELIQILWNEVRSGEDLQRFEQRFGSELDQDFIMAIAGIVKQARENGDENVANFFMQIGQGLISLAQASQGAQAPSGFSGAEAEIKAEDDAINELRKTDPSAAYTRAVANLERAKQTGNDRLICYCAFTLANIADELRPYPRLKEAIQAYELASEKALATGNEKGYAVTQNNLGNAYLSLPTGDMGDNLKNAISCYNNALRIRTEKDFPQGFAMTQNNLGIAYLYLPAGDRGENLKNAITYYNNALRIYTEDKFPYEYGRTQNNLGIAYAELPTGDRGENLKNSISCYNNALRITTEDKFPLDYATTQNNLGNAYAKLPTGDRGENLKNAVECYQNALRIYTEKDFPQDYAMTQNNVGIAYSDLPTGDRGENLKNAIACYQNALRIRTEKDFPQNCVDTLYNLALAYDDDFLNDLQNAYKICDKAIEVLETRIRAVSSAETRRALAEFYGGRIYARIVSLCIRLGKPEEALSFAERGKSRTLIEMLHAAHLQPSEKVPKEIKEAFAAVREKLESLRSQSETGKEEMTIATPSDEKSAHVFKTGKTALNENIRQQREEAQKSYDSLLNKIRKLDPEFAASERVLPITVEEIQAMIPPNTVFAECFTGYDGTYIFVLDSKNSINQSYILLKELNLDRLSQIVDEYWLNPYRQKNTDIYKWKETIENIPGLLSEIFWNAKDENGKSLASLIEEKKTERIVFMPHAGLHLLPLHLIPVNEKQLLMDKYEISYAPSASMLRFKKQKKAHEQPMLFAVANPDKSLVFTDIEVENIAKHFPNPHILWHENAVKQNVIKEAKNAEIAHFSCHGNFGFKNPLDSCLQLSQEYLTLKDIFADLKIPEARAVVLSACESGMVKSEYGDEYIGLSSGFMYAGARSVISALWAVPDFATHLLMMKFYDNLLGKKIKKTCEVSEISQVSGMMRPAAALRNAQQYMRELTAREIRPLLEQYLEETKERIPPEDRRINSFNIQLGRCDCKDDEKLFEHPYYWGAFICTGIAD